MNPDQPDPQSASPQPSLKVGLAFMTIAVGVIILLALALVLGLAGNLGKPKVKVTTPAAMPSAMVNITKAGFVPATISIKAGQAVVWTNSDASPHDVTLVMHGKANSSAGQSLNQNDTYTYVFNQTGTFTYQDSINPSLPGSTIIVK
jgi:plastocyanin